MKKIKQIKGENYSPNKPKSKKFYKRLRNHILRRWPIDSELSVPVISRNGYSW